VLLLAARGFSRDAALDDGVPYLEVVRVIDPFFHPLTPASNQARDHGVIRIDLVNEQSAIRQQADGSDKVAMPLLVKHTSLDAPTDRRRRPGKAKPYPGS